MRLRIRQPQTIDKGCDSPFGSTAFEIWSKHAEVKRSHWWGASYSGRPQCGSTAQEESNRTMNKHGQQGGSSHADRIYSWETRNATFTVRQLVCFKMPCIDRTIYSGISLEKRFPNFARNAICSENHGSLHKRFDFGVHHRSISGNFLSFPISRCSFQCHADRSCASAQYATDFWAPYPSAECFGTISCPLILRCW